MGLVDPSWVDRDVGESLSEPFFNVPAPTEVVPLHSAFFIGPSDLQ